MNVLTHLSNIDFNLYCGSQAQRKLIFAIKDTYAISGMLVDSSHCLGVSTIEDSELTNELYYKIRLLCNKEKMCIRDRTKLDDEQAQAFAEELISLRIPSAELQSCLDRGLKQVNTLFEEGEYFLADLMLYLIHI